MSSGNIQPSSSIRPTPQPLPGGIEMGIKMLRARDEAINRLLEKGVLEGTIKESQKEIIASELSQSKVSMLDTPSKAIATAVRSSIFKMANIDEGKFYAILIASAGDIIAGTRAEKYNQLMKRLVKEDAITERDRVRMMIAINTGGQKTIAEILSKMPPVEREEVINTLLPLDTLLKSKKVFQEAVNEERANNVISEQVKQRLLLNLNYDQVLGKKEVGITQFVTDLLGNNLDRKVSPDKVISLLRLIPKYELEEAELKGIAAKVKGGKSVQCKDYIPKVDEERKRKLKEKFSYERGEKIPTRVLNFDVTRCDSASGHTMDTKKYLENRLPNETLTKIKNCPNTVDFFLGGFNEMVDFYASQTPPLFYVGQLKSPTSTQFHLFEDPNNSKNYTIAISGIGSQSRMNHQCLQFKFGGINLSGPGKDSISIKVRGTFKDMYENDFTFLQDSLKKYAERYKGQPMVCVIGARRLPMEFLGRRVYPETKGSSEGVAYERMNPEHFFQGALSYDIAPVETKDQGKVIMITFRMPNGALARNVTETLLEGGVSSFIMVGAGGSLTTASGVGAYQMITEASYAEESITLPQKAIATPDVSGTGLEPHFKADGRNITVDSPLEEHQEWLDGAKRNKSVVDVESFHILQAIHQKLQMGADIRVVPGLFNSDVVGEHPLEEKIDISNAYPHLELFLNCAYRALGINIKEQ